MSSLQCTWGSDRPVKRTGGDARRQVYQAVQGETSLGIGEPTRTIRNGVNFHNMVDVWCIRRFTLSDNRSEDNVSVSRDQLRGPRGRAVCQIHRKFIGKCQLTEMGSNSREASIDR